MSARRVRRSIRRRSANARSLASLVERLESRELLSSLPEARTSYVVMHPVAESATPGPTNSGYTPAQIQQAYGFNQVSNNGSGETIAIVDAYNDPKISSDLATFDGAYGLAPPPSFKVVNQSGGSSLPSSNASWGGEESLDVEWAHAMAPGAKILLVEASSASDTNLLAAVKYASSVAQVVSMSWGGGEFSGETSYDSSTYFGHAGVAFVAASGDSGAPAEWPSTSPDVLGVGGTSLTLNSGGGWGGETGWSGSTGGPSTYESQPSYQNGVVTQTTTKRATPDVAYDGDPNTGFAVYDSYGYSGWLQVGGTSAGAPQWSAIIAIADEGRSQPLGTSGLQSVQSILYPNGSADFHDITSGNNGYAAGPGYDYVTGLGSPMVNDVVASLDGGTVTAPDKLVITGAPQGPVAAGSSFNVTVTAETSSGQVDPGFAGTVSFTSTDGQAVLPGSYTFTTGTGGDDGVHTFSVTLRTAGSQGITASDGSSSATAQVTVTPAAASQLVISISPTATVGSPLTFTVTARDPYGNVATGYAGTVSFTSTDGQAVLPAGYTFTTGAGADDGAHTFTVTFNTVGTQTVTATDSGNSLSVTSGSVQVSSTAPPPSTESIWGTSYHPTVNAHYQGSRGQTFELGVQFESDVGGQVTGVLFYKQRGATGANVGHLWSSSGTLLASVAFTHETSSGWQEANFSSSVTIQANTFYTISYDTGSPLFYFDSGYFANGGVTNGNLTAPAYTDIGGTVLGNGVYNYGGDFPVASQYQANFWVDVVFSPSSGSIPSFKTAAVAGSAGGSGAAAIGQSGYAITPATSATPAGPMGVVPGSQGISSSSSTARRPSASFAVVSGRPVVTQARAPVFWGHKATSFLS